MRGFKGMAFLLAGALLLAPTALAQTARPIDSAKLRAPAARLQVQQATTVTTTPAPADQPQPVSAVVPANTEWIETPVTVQNGGRLQITAGDGRWSIVGPNATARIERLMTNADGFSERTNPQAMSPTSNLGALIGKIGANGAPFLVGSKYDAAAGADGALFLAINDQPGGYGDNVGRMPVSIIFTPPAPQPQTDNQGEVPNAPPQDATPTTETTTADAPESAPDQQQVSNPANPTPEPAALPEWSIPVGVGALLIAAILLWPRPKPSAKARQTRRNSPRAGVVTRIVSDGRGGQQLSVRWRDRK